MACNLSIFKLLYNKLLQGYFVKTMRRDILKKKTMIDLIVDARFFNEIADATHYDFEEIKENKKREELHEKIQNYISKLKLPKDKENKLSNMILDLSYIGEEELLEFNIEYFKVGLKEGINLVTIPRKFEFHKKGEQ